MAGFDFGFTYTEPQRDLVLACIAASKSRARRLGLRWRTHRLANGETWCQIDGDGARMGLLARVLERDLPTICEAVEVSGLTRARRRSLGLGFADLYVRGMDATSDAVSPLRGTAQIRYYFPVYELSGIRGSESLSARLAVTEGVLTEWALGEAPAAIVLEELHTACELVLQHLVNPRSKRLSFAEMVELADGADLLGPRQLHGRSPRDLLIELKDFRKNARHKGDDSYGDWLDRSWEDVGAVLHRLVEGPRPSVGTTRRRHR